MVRHILVIAGVGEISSGAVEPAIAQITLSRAVNNESRLAPGCVSPAVLQATLFASPAVTHFYPGQKIELYTLLPDGTRRKEGVFYLDTAVWSARRRCHITARDALGKLDVDVAGYINSLTGWPYRLGALAGKICSYCGLTLTTTSFPWSDLYVEKGIYYYVTAAQVMGWIAAIAGRFCRASGNAGVEFGWYTATPSRVGVRSLPGKARLEFMGGALFVEAQKLDLTDCVLTATGATVTYDSGVLTLVLPEHPPVYGCLQGGLHRQETPVSPPDGVRIGYSYAAMCKPYPEGGDVLTITGIRLLKELPVAQMTRLAATVYDDLKNLSYTPCRLRVSAEADILPGQILTFSDGVGEYKTLVTATERVGTVTEIKGGTL